jgi:uncharacterized delta-60 repeat protein
MAQLIETMEGRQLFAGGALDTTFGDDGVSTLLFRVAPHETATVEKIVSDSGGRTYVLASTRTNVFADRTTLQIRRLDATGALDGTFARDRSNNLLFPLTSTSRAFLGQDVFDIAIDGSNRLDVLIGNHVYRITAAGTLDASFGNKGTVTLPGTMKGTKLALDASGRMYVIGANVEDAELQHGQAVVARLTANGVLDTTFQGDGVYEVPHSAPAGATAAQSAGARIRTLADGSVQVLAYEEYSNTDDSIFFRYSGTESFRFNASGALLRSYGTNGLATYFQRNGDVTFFSSEPVGIRSDGVAVLYESGATDDPNGNGGISDNVVISADGKSIGRFAKFGKTKTDVIGAISNQQGSVDFIHQADGSELVVDKLPGRLTKISASGAYDNSFNGGNAITNVHAAALQADGTVVTAGNGSVRNAVTLKRIFRDDAPAATLAAKPLRAAATSLRFSVTYRAPGGVDADTVTGQELRIIGADGISRRPRLVSKTVLDDGSLLATYKTTDTSGGAWDSSDNGTYAVRVLADLVKAENGVAMAKRTVGSFTVAIA